MVREIAHVVHVRAVRLIWGVCVVFLWTFLCGGIFAEAATVTTTIAVSICGNAVVDTGEVCDDGLFNDGGYGSTTATRHCNSTCSGFGPYCGDSILQALYLEQCDDGNNTDGDICSALCLTEFPPIATTTGGGGGAGGGGSFDGLVPVKAQTKVLIKGKAYPNATVNILRDGQIAGLATADTLADFSYETTSITPGPTTFGFWANDALGLRSITFTTSFQVTQNAVTTVSNVYLPPTIDLRSKKIAPGDPVEAFGSSAPSAQLQVFLDREQEPKGGATSTPGGAWSVSVPTLGVAGEAFHTIKASFDYSAPGETPAKSGYSQALNFYLGSRDVSSPISADLNGDGKVNLIDFSILLFHWGTDHAIADLNQSGRVDLTDFSIMLFNWTG